MIYGGNLPIECQCGLHPKYKTLGSGNTCGAYLWSDGFQFAPQRPILPPLVKCCYCSHISWLDDGLQMGELCDGELVEPTEIEYYSALASGLARTAKDERITRIYAWWKSNEPLRNGERPTKRKFKCVRAFVEVEIVPENGKRVEFNSNPTARVANMESLLSFLDEEDENDRIVKAEILRELGQFDEAIAMLATIASPKYSFMVDLIQSLCNQGDTLVKRML